MTSLNTKFGGLFCEHSVKVLGKFKEISPRFFGVRRGRQRLLQLGIYFFPKFDASIFACHHCHLQRGFGSHPAEISGKSQGNFRKISAEISMKKGDKFPQSDRNREIIFVDQNSAKMCEKVS